MVQEHVVIELREMRATRVRYKRANLSIRRWGDFNRGELGAAISDYRTSAVDADALCWAFARSRVESHTPSFSWDEADLGRVLKLVCAASTDPVFDSYEPGIFAATVIEAADQEAEELKRTAAKTRKAIEGVFGGRYQMLRDAQKKFDLLGGNSALLQMAREQFAAREDLARTLRGVGGLEQITGPFALDARKKLAKTLGGVGFGERGGSEVLRNLGLSVGGKEFQNLAKRLGPTGTLTSSLDPKLFQTPPWLEGLRDARGLIGNFEEAAQQFARLRTRSLPSNWHDLESDELKATVKLMGEEGLSLAWAPRVEIIRLLLGADDHQARCEVLVARRDDIVEDVETVLVEVEHQSLAPIVEGCREAIATYRDGHSAPAQAYAATAIGEIVHGPLGGENFGIVRATFGDKDPWHDVGMSEFALYAIGAAWLRVLARFKDAGDGFNRHLTLHRLGSPYSEPNLLTVLMLLAGLLRELDGIAQAQDRQQGREEAA